MKYLIISEDEHNALIASIDHMLQLQKEILSKKLKAQIMSNADFVKLFRISKRTSQHWCDVGIIDFVKIGNLIYYETDAIEKMLKNHRVKGFR